MCGYLKRRNNRINKEEKKILFDLVKKIFNIHIDLIEKIYKDIEQFEYESNVDFIYFVSCIFKYNKITDTFTIYFNNIKNYKNINSILNLISLLLKDIVLDSRFIDFESKFNDDINSIDKIINTNLVKYLIIFLK